MIVMTQEEMTQVMMETMEMNDNKVLIWDEAIFFQKEDEISKTELALKLSKYFKENYKNELQNLQKSITGTKRRV